MRRTPRMSLAGLGECLTRRQTEAGTEHPQPGYLPLVPSAPHRLAAFVSGVMMLVLLLAESGFACTMPDMASSARAGAGMSAMAHMPGMTGMVGMAEMARITAPDGTAPTEGQDEAPCRFPWAPSGCRDMAPCAPAALTVAAWRGEGGARVHEVQRAAAVLVPLSFGTPPELPPPRA